MGQVEVGKLLATHVVGALVSVLSATARGALSFEVPGQPRTKGSLQARARRCHCTKDCPGYLGATQLRDSVASKRWRALCAYQAQQAMAVTPGEDWPVAGSVAVVALFGLRAADIEAQGAGDVDKLARNLLDAMQDAELYANDSQVHPLYVDKFAIEPDQQPTTLVRVAWY